MPVDEEEAMFRRMDEKKDGFKNAMFQLDKIWAETYKNLDQLIARDRPDFIFTDAMDIAGNDMAAKWKIPVASNHAQLPKHVAPAKHTPGIPGLQQKYISSEHATLRERIYEELWSLKFMWSLKDLIIANGKMRKSHGVAPNKPQKHADHLMLVNSCFGIELPKDLPPLVVPCGPILSDEYSPMGELEPFFNEHKKVMFVAFGSRCNLPHWRAKRLIKGMHNAMRSGYIDGVVWGLRVDKVSLGNSNGDGKDEEDHGTSPFSYNSILQNQNPHWKIIPWTPQRAILDHPSTALFISHCGGSSTMEAIYHGVPVISMGIFGDQKANSKRLKLAGVGLELNKDAFTANELCEKIGTITQDLDGSFGRNVLRMQRIAKLESKRKHLAADMIEEVLFDHELRFEHIPDNEKGVSKNFHGYGRSLRPMFLETAPARMSFVKANNLDMWLVFILAFVVVVYCLIFTTRAIGWASGALYRAVV